MKFIKTVDGYISAANVNWFHISNNYVDDRITVQAEMVGNPRFVCIVKEFKTRDEAQAYLDKLIAELEEANGKNSSAT